MAQTIGRRAVIEDVTWLISQGATNAFSLTWNTGTADDPEPYDFTGHTARLQVRRRPGADAWVTLTSTPSASGQIGIDGTTLLVELEPEASSAWGTANRTGQWDLEIEDPTGDVVRLVMGPVEVSLETTVTEVV